MAGFLRFSQKSKLFPISFSQEGIFSFLKSFSKISSKQFRVTVPYEYKNLKIPLDKVVYIKPRQVTLFTD